MDIEKPQSIFAKAIECLHQRINSEDAYIDSVQSISWDETDNSGNLIDLQLTVKVNSDVLAQPPIEAAL